MLALKSRKGRRGGGGMSLPKQRALCIQQHQLNRSHRGFTEEIPVDTYTSGGVGLGTPLNLCGAQPKLLVIPIFVSQSE